MTEFGNTRGTEFGNGGPDDETMSITVLPAGDVRPGRASPGGYGSEPPICNGGVEPSVSGLSIAAGIAPQVLADRIEACLSPYGLALSGQSSQGIHILNLSADDKALIISALRQFH